jgi:BirA family biotin operon repressor/biotin-[acetyl-CoA-carboxylase] ligase
MFVFESLLSTNRWMLDNVHSCSHGDVIRALQQTAGRGRFNRAWVTPGRRNLTFSVLLDYDVADEWLAPVTGQVAAMAVRIALEEYAVPALLKWPNDVLVRGKKIAGILAERHSETGRIVLGIGLNVNLSATDLATMDLAQPATSMHIETGQEFDIDSVFVSLLKHLESSLDSVRREGKKRLTESWRSHDALIGESIAVHTENSIISGHYSGLDDDGRLCLVDDTGQKYRFWAGDVSIRQSRGQNPVS